MDDIGRRPPDFMVRRSPVVVVVAMVIAAVDESREASERVRGSVFDAIQRRSVLAPKLNTFTPLLLANATKHM